MDQQNTQRLGRESLCHGKSQRQLAEPRPPTLRRSSNKACKKISNLKNIELPHKRSRLCEKEITSNNTQRKSVGKHHCIDTEGSDLTTYLIVHSSTLARACSSVLSPNTPSHPIAATYTPTISSLLKMHNEYGQRTSSHPILRTASSSTSHPLLRNFSTIVLEVESNGFPPAERHCTALKTQRRAASAFSSALQRICWNGGGMST